jgi:cytochrome c oxidase subunit 2
MRSLDVIHAFFVPQFRTNEDIVPGLVTTVHVTPDRLGTYELVCNELCGLGHSLMNTEAVVMKAPAFDAWLKQQGKAAGTSTTSATGSTSTTTTSTTSSSASGLSVFNDNGCSSCHTLSAAGASGKVGPDLDKLVAYAKQAHQPLDKFVQQSIVDPGAYVQPGFSNLMPSNFGTAISKADLGSLVTFLIQSATKQGSTKG